MKLLIAIFLSVALAACFSLEAASWGEWTENELSQQGTSSTAKFDWSDWPGMIVRIDNHDEVASGFKSARLVSVS